MSASLVGSEMCIRDSRPPKCLWPATGLLQAVSGALRQNKNAGNRRQAVSYTHLTLPTICSV
eukprot:1843891-Alexandrium_andersonii.AAC.1